MAAMPNARVKSPSTRDRRNKLLGSLAEVVRDSAAKLPRSRSGLVSESDRTRERVIEIYRRKAKHYDITSRLSPVPGYPERAQRRRAVQALRLRPGDSVVDVACGTGLNFPLIQKLIGPDGRILGVDLTDAMLARAQKRIATNGWSNVSLVQADAADFHFPTEVDAILSTYALTQVPDCAQVVAHGAAALAESGRWVVLDLRMPTD